jgi:hypothetical protein
VFSEGKASEGILDLVGYFKKARKEVSSKIATISFHFFKTKK